MMPETTCRGKSHNKQYILIVNLCKLNPWNFIYRQKLYIILLDQIISLVIYNSWLKFRFPFFYKEIPGEQRVLQCRSHKCLHVYFKSEHICITINRQTKYSIFKFYLKGVQMWATLCLKYVSTNCLIIILKYKITYSQNKALSYACLFRMYF